MQRDVIAASKEDAEPSCNTVTVYEKPRERLRDHEKACIAHLESNGIYPIVLAEDPKASANIDLMIDGQLWEMKNVTNNRSSIKNQFKRSREKWRKLGLLGKPRIVMTTENATVPFEEIIESVLERIREGEMVTVISSNGVIRRLGK